eukprot:scaffold71750_cov30-Tisochrysis_lutea.AAC.8
MKVPPPIVQGAHELDLRGLKARAGRYLLLCGIGERHAAWRIAHRAERGAGFRFSESRAPMRGAVACSVWGSRKSNPSRSCAAVKRQRRGGRGFIDTPGRGEKRANAHDA